MTTRFEALNPCAKKFKWDDWAGAEGHRIAIVETGHAKDPSRLHSYRCEDCGFWHVGHGSRVLYPELAEK